MCACMNIKIFISVFMVRRESPLSLCPRWKDVFKCAEDKKHCLTQEGIWVLVTFNCGSWARRLLNRKVDEALLYILKNILIIQRAYLKKPWIWYGMKSVWQLILTLFQLKNKFKASVTCAYRRTYGAFCCRMEQPSVDQSNFSESSYSLFTSPTQVTELGEKTVLLV